MHNEIRKQFDNSRLSQDGVKALVTALETVWKKHEAQAIQDSSRIRQRMTSIVLDIANRTDAAIDPSNISIKVDILKSIDKLKDQLEEMENEVTSLSKKIDTDKNRFMTFALDFTSRMGDNFLSI